METPGHMPNTRTPTTSDLSTDQINRHYVPRGLRQEAPPRSHIYYCRNHLHGPRGPSHHEQSYQSSTIPSIGESQDSQRQHAGPSATSPRSRPDHQNHRRSSLPPLKLVVAQPGRQPADSTPQYATLTQYATFSRPGR